MKKILQSFFALSFLMFSCVRAVEKNKVISYAASAAAIAIDAGAAAKVVHTFSDGNLAATTGAAAVMSAASFVYRYMGGNFPARNSSDQFGRSAIKTFNGFVVASAYCKATKIPFDPTLAAACVLTHSMVVDPLAKLKDMKCNQPS